MTGKEDAELFAVMVFPNGMVEAGPATYLLDWPSSVLRVCTITFAPRVEALRTAFSRTFPQRRVAAGVHPT